MDDGVTEGSRQRTEVRDGRGWLAARVGLLEQVRERAQVLLRERDAERFDAGLAALWADLDRLLRDEPEASARDLGRVKRKGRAA